jgi:hypothetical protein
MSNLIPCATCPWRVERDARTIPAYNHEKACDLMNTVGEGDSLRPIMACHMSTESDLWACNGYLARVGWTNINVRILLAKGEIASPSKVLDECKARGIELETSYENVLSKLSESQRDG